MSARSSLGHSVGTAPCSHAWEKPRGRIRGMRGCMGRISGLAGTVTTENRSPSYTPAIKNTGIPATWNSTSPCGDGSQIPRVGTRQRRARDQNPLPCFSWSKSFSLRALKTGLLPVGGGKPHNRVRHSMSPAPPTMTGTAPLGQTGSTVSPLEKPARRPAFHDDRAATTSASVNGWNSCMCVAPPAHYLSAWWL